jgi:hypothetical protein
MLDKSLHNTLEAFEMRESSNYEIGITFGRDEVQLLVKNAEEF